MRLSYTGSATQSLKLEQTGSRCVYNKQSELTERDSSQVTTGMARFTQVAEYYAVAFEIRIGAGLHGQPGTA